VSLEYRRRGVMKGAPHSVLDIAHSRPPWDSITERLLPNLSGALQLGVKSGSTPVTAQHQHKRGRQRDTVAILLRAYSDRAGGVYFLPRPFLCAATCAGRISAGVDLQFPRGLGTVERGLQFVGPRAGLSRSLKGGQVFRSGRTRRRIESFSRFVNRQPNTPAGVGLIG